MKNFMYSEVRTSPHGPHMGYEQTIWCADNGTRVRKMWRTGEEASFLLLSMDNRIIVNDDDLLTAFVAAWHFAWQHDEDLETDARLQTEKYGFFVSLNSFRRTWGTYWISGDRPTWVGGYEI